MKEKKLYQLCKENLELFLNKKKLSLIDEDKKDLLTNIFLSSLEFKNKHNEVNNNKIISYFIKLYVNVPVQRDTEELKEDKNIIYDI